MNRGGKKAQGKKVQEPAYKLKRDVLTCPGCDFTCSSISNLRVHFLTTKHDQIRENKPHSFPQAPATDMTDETEGIIPDHVKKSVFILKDYTQHPAREPIIGLEYVQEYRLQTAPGQTRIRYYCRLCDVDCDLNAMMEHLSCYRHRKLYLMKELPYVLRAPSGAKENRAAFMRRMAMEIEREEGTKAYTMDPITRLKPMKAPDANPSKIKTRWSYEGEKQKRMRKALEYLETFEIDNDIEASTVSRLTEKLTVELKYHADKLKEAALFPAKVARAKDVAMSIMKNFPIKQQSKNEKNPVQKGPSRFTSGPPENINVSRPSGPPQPTRDNTSLTPKAAIPTANVNVGKPSGPPQPKGDIPSLIPKAAIPPGNVNTGKPSGPQPKSDIPSLIPKAPIPPGNVNTAKQSGPPQTKSDIPSLAPKAAVAAENVNTGKPSGQNNQSSTPNAAIPPGVPPPPSQNFQSWTPSAAVPPGNLNMGRPIGPPPPIPYNAPWAPSVPPPAFPPWAPNAAFPSQNMAQPNSGQQTAQSNEDNKFVKKLKLLLSVLQPNSTSGDSAQMTSKLLLFKSLLQNTNTANQLPAQMGSMPADMASAENMALYQQLQLMAAQNPAAMAQFGPNIMMQMDSMVNNAAPMENAQMNQNQIMQMAAQLQNNQINSFMPENQGFVSEFGNSNLMGQMDPNYQNQYVEGQQGFADTFQSNEGYGYDGQMAGSNTMRPYDDFPAEEAPYTRVTLSPTRQRAEDERFRDGGYERDLRRESRSSYGDRRPLNEPAWAERESDGHYGKRAKWDERGRHYPDEGDAAGTSAPNLSVDLLKRIRGKDLFTVSAILSEYADNQ